MYLKMIAFDDYEAAKVLWNQHNTGSARSFRSISLQLMQESTEKYLKVLWAKNKEFSDVNDFTEQLRKLESKHDIHRILGKLNLKYREKLEAVFKKHPFRSYQLDGLRYGTKTPLVDYNESEFRSRSIFINEIQQLLDKKMQLN